MGPNDAFGPIFIVPVAYFNIRSYIFNKTLVSMSKYDEKMKKHSPTVQTTHLASFGPFIVVPALLVAYFDSRTYMLNKAFVSI